MKLIRTEDAAGQVLCHEITQSMPGECKGARFRKGHVIQPEDIPVLLSIGKENLYVWEKKPGILHEDEAAALLYKAAAGKNIHGTEPKEGKIELIADCDGLLKIDRDALLAVNRTPQMIDVYKRQALHSGKGLRVHGDDAVGHSLPEGDGLFAHVHHHGVAGGIEMGQIGFSHDRIFLLNKNKSYWKPGLPSQSRFARQLPQRGSRWQTGKRCV